MENLFTTLNLMLLVACHFLPPWGYMLCSLCITPVMRKFHEASAGAFSAFSTPASTRINRKDCEMQGIIMEAFEAHL